jgi:hypothetical protein
MHNYSNMIRKNKNHGRGNTDEYRNRAVVILRNNDPKTYSFYRLGKVFNISTIRAQQVYKENS